MFFRLRPFRSRPRELVAVGQRQGRLERTAYLVNSRSLIAPSRNHAAILRIGGDGPVVLACQCLFQLPHKDVGTETL